MMASSLALDAVEGDIEMSSVASVSVEGNGVPGSTNHSAEPVEHAPLVANEEFLGHADAAPQNSHTAPQRADAADPQPDIIRVTYQGQKGRFYYHPRHVAAGEMGDAVMQHLKTWWAEEVAGTMFWQPLRLIFFKPAIEMATIAHPRNFETRQWPIEVVVLDPEPCRELTESLYHPVLLAGAGAFSSLYPEVMASSPSHRVLLVAVKLRKNIVVGVTLVAALLSIGAGIGTGFGTGNPGYGFECTAALASIMGAVIVVLLWILH